MPFFTGASGRTYYRTWRLAQPKSVVILLHGAGEHSGHYHRLAGALNAAGIEVWGIDHIGHGLTEGDRGAIKGIPELASNAAELIALARAERPDLPFVLVGHSLGGVTAGYLLTRGATGFQGTVLAGTPLKPGPIVAPADLVVTKDPFYIDILDTDPLVFTFTPERLAERRRLMQDVRDDMGDRLAALDLPILLINGTEDAIAPHDYASDLAPRLRDGSIIVHEGGHHDIINDLPFEAVQKQIADFVTRVTA